MNEHASNLYRTRANMLGTDDEEHYWQCHDAAKEIERQAFALKTIATLPMVEQDSMLSANMRKIAQDALAVRVNAENPDAPSEAPQS